MSVSGEAASALPDIATSAEKMAISPMADLLITATLLMHSVYESRKVLSKEALYLDSHT